MLKAKKEVKEEKVIDSSLQKRGRPAKYAGTKLFKTEMEPAFRAGTGKETAYKLIKKGMKYETFALAGGNGKSLDDLIRGGFVEATAP